MNRDELTRRDFLAAAAIAATTGTAARLLAAGGPEGEGGGGRSKFPDVVQVRSDHVVRGHQIHKQVLPEMIEAAIRRMTGKSTAAEAWKSLLSSDDVIGLKFNRSGSEGLATTEPFATALISSLLAAGFESRQIVAIEAPDRVYRRHGVGAPVHSWDASPSDFTSGQDSLAGVLDQVTAIINIPFLKTHNIAGFTGCLKNLSHGLIKHPARFHGSHCSPYIADIVALPRIRDKLRLHLVNAVRVVFDRGPDAYEDAIWDAGLILAGKDPVACDSVGLGILNTHRTEVGLDKIDRYGARTAYLQAAAERGLGISDPYDIEMARLRI